MPFSLFLKASFSLLDSVCNSMDEGHGSHPHPVFSEYCRSPRLVRKISVISFRFVCTEGIVNSTIVMEIGCESTVELVLVL